MKCPKCNEEIAHEDAIFCQKCGEKLNINKKYCPKCGELIKSNVSSCSNCGYNFSNTKSASNITYRSPAFILGIIGSVIGFLLGLISLTSGLSILLRSSIIILTLSSIGFISTLYLRINQKIGGIVMLIVALFFLLNSYNFGLFEVIFLGGGGLLAIFRK